MLWKKVFRDLNENKGAYLACAVIIIIALMVFTSFSMVSDNLTMSQQSFYTNQNFADGFINTQALPFARVENLGQIGGIADIQGRMVKDVRVLAPDRDENVYLRLVSIDLDRDNPINAVFLTQGIPLENRGTNIWVDSMFFDANNLELNDILEIVAVGQRRQLQIVGVGKSPEFIYALRTAADIFPSPETFGIAFVPLEIMQVLFPQNRAFNDVVFTLEPGADFDKIKVQLEYQLEPYGLTAIFPRADHVSHLLLTTELDSLRIMATALPILFLLIAGAILYIVLKRLIEQQRGQIGILKALGYTQGEIISHYLFYAVIIGLSGGILGAVLGMFLSAPLTNLYQMFFNMPGMAGGFQVRYLFFGVLLSLGFSLVAGYQGCKGVLALEPAEAMRPPAPVIGKKVLLEQIGFIWNMFTVQGMMAVRNISRNKGRSVFIFLGIMFCFAISSFTGSMNELYQKMLYDQYERVEMYDVKVTFARPLDERSVVRELQAFPGVHSVEAMAEIPVTLSNKWHEQGTILLGLPLNSQLYNILDKNYNKIEPPQDGLLLSERLADLLEADIGTILILNSPMLREINGKHLEVVGIVPQYLGMNAYMELGAVQDFLRQGSVATSVMISMDEERIPALQQRYLESDVVVGVDDISQRLAQMQELMNTFGSTIYVFLVVGIIIGFAIIYTSSIITVSERSRELASMMVLGMTPKEVLSVITFEQWVLGIPAMVAGIPLAYILMASMAGAVSTDAYTMPVVITFYSYLLATFVTVSSIWIAQMAAARKVRGLSLVEVLKSGD